ncbi:MAG TPA: IclR family transcriptional regulator [Nakamurella sp.]|nr:IclR family transcriptional regulator [Nakamurella sp.]
MPDRDADPADRYKVHSVARALRMLELLADPSAEAGLGVTEIAEATGLSKSAAFAVLQTLLDGGYVADSGIGQQRRYHLGPALTRLGDRARSQTPLREVARPTLRRLADELGLSVRLGVLQEEGIGVIDRVDAHGGLRIDLRMGDRELLHTTAIGKAILAAHSDPEARRILGRRKLVRRTPRTITELGALIDHLQSVRSCGYAIDDEEDYQGIICIGAAIRDHTGAAEAAISVTTLKAGLTAERLASIGEALVGGARDISTALGFSATQSDSAALSRSARI